MKKLMIAAAIVCAAAFAQAAAVDWDVGDIQDSPNATVAEGWIAYLVDGTKYDAFIALAAGDVAAWVATAGNTLDKQEVYEGRAGFEVSGNGGSWNAEATASAFAVLFDSNDAATAKNYAYTAVGTDVIAATGQDGYISFGDFADAMKETGSSGGWQATAAPEPTSGLLLLLGVAGLALRRRRA